VNRSFFIAGVQFRPRNEINKATETMKVGDHLTLSPEPSNKFDSNAVQIHYESPYDEEWENKGFSTFLGYVPKKFSAEISAAIEVGIDLECTIEEINSGAKLWEMCKVTVKNVSDIEEEAKMEGK
jgi:hypothetical protein